MNIKSNSFAETCYNQNSMHELRSALNSPADKTDIKNWNISEKEYFDGIIIAIKAKLFDAYDALSIWN